MRILAINASHRGDKGYTRFFVDKLFEGATEAGADCEVVTLVGLTINHCIACGTCQTQQHYLKCVYHDEDDAGALFDKMAEADVIVFATPIYLMNMSGLLKTFIDRLYSTMDCAKGELTVSGLIHHHVNRAVSSKPFVTLVVCGNLETETWKSVPAYFRTYARFMDAEQIGTLVRNAAMMFDSPKSAKEPGLTTGTGFDAALDRRAGEICAAYVRAGHELATTGRIRRSTQRRANREVVPVPLFKILKHLKPVKKMIVEYISKM